MYCDTYWSEIVIVIDYSWFLFSEAAQYKIASSIFTTEINTFPICEYFFLIYWGDEKKKL